jgi:hypothetical protein
MERRGTIERAARGVYRFPLLTPNPELGMPLMTFGYGARSCGEMLALLARYGIGYVIDVRSVPWSRYRPEFSQDQLAASLRAYDVRYVFMGDELGGRPEDPACYDDEGRVDYRACAQQPAFRAGIGRLRDAWVSGHSVALMCSEGRPEDCHRTKLVSAALVETGVDVRHIDEQGELRTHDEVLDRLRGPQTTLLEDADLLAKSRNRYRAACRILRADLRRVLTAEKFGDPWFHFERKSHHLREPETTELQRISPQMTSGRGFDSG